MRRPRPPVLRVFERELDRPHRTRPVIPDAVLDDAPKEAPHTIVSSAELGWVIRDRTRWMQKNRRLVVTVGAGALLFTAIWVAGFNLLAG